MAETQTEYDNRFLAKLRAQDERAYSRFVTDYQDRIFAYCLRILGSSEEARDVAQDVFVSVFMALPRFRGECKLSTWLYRIALNHCRNRLAYLRRRASAQRRELSEIIEPENMGAELMNRPHRPDQMTEGRQLEVLLQQWIAELDDDQRETLVLRDIENLTYHEIMEITGLPEGTVKSRIHRARQVLQEKVEQFRMGNDTQSAHVAVLAKAKA